MTVIRKPVHFDTLAKNIYGLNISLIISAVKSGKGTVLQESTEQHVLVAFTAAKLLRLQPATLQSQRETAVSGTQSILISPTQGHSHKQNTQSKQIKKQQLRSQTDLK